MKLYILTLLTILLCCFSNFDLCAQIECDIQDFLIFENSPNHVHTGFITRLDQDGSIISHHNYKEPNDEYLPKSKYGRYRQSQLNEIVDGTILAGGNHFYHRTVYDHPDFDDTKEENLLWVLKVDADEGLDGEDCDEVIENGGGIEALNDIRLFAEINSTWHHCLVVDGQEPWTLDLNNEVVDTFSQNGYLYSTIKGEFIGHSANPLIDSITIANKENIVYYQEGDSLHVLYDFDVIKGDTLTLRFPVLLDTDWYDNNTTVSNFFKIIIDSIEVVNIDGEELRRVYFDEFNELDDNQNYIWTPTDLGGYYTEKLGYENFILPYIVTGFDESNTGCDLKEFDNNNIFFNNEKAYCFTVNTNDLYSEYIVKLFPNPANNEIRIRTEDTFASMSIHNIVGEIVYKGQFEPSISISNFPDGVYYLFLSRHETNNIITRKFVINR